MTIALNILQFTTESLDSILVCNSGWKVKAPFELAISLLILVALSENSVLVLDHFLDFYCTDKTHKGYGVAPARTDVKLF